MEESKKPNVTPPVKSAQLPAEKKLTQDLVLAKSKAGSLVEIKKVVIWGQKITDCSIVTEIPDLEVASMTANRISSLEHFGQCPNLKELYLRNNCISDLAEVYHLRELPNLQVLWLAGNPCTKHPKYRSSVVRNLEQLVTLDDTEVTPAERETCEADGELFEEPPRAPDSSPDEEAVVPTREQPEAPAEPSLTSATYEAPSETPSSTASSSIPNRPPSPPIVSSVFSSSVQQSATSLTALDSAGCQQLPRYALTEVRTAVLRLIRLLDNESLQLVMLTVKTRLDAGTDPACGLDNL